MLLSNAVIRQVLVVLMVKVTDKLCIQAKWPNSQELVPVFVA